MPPVRNLTTPKAVAVAPSIPIIEKPAPQAAAAPAQRTSPSGHALATLPAWAQPVAPLPKINSGPAAVYVGQLQPNTGKRQSLLAVGVKDGEYYLDNMGEVTPLEVFRFFLLDARAFKTEMNAAGEIVYATRDMEARRPMTEEHAVALILVDTPHGWVPAKCDFRKAQAPAYVAASNGVEFAQEIGFSDASDAHRVAAQFPVPFGRVLTTVNIERRVSKSSGKPYFLSAGTVAPTSVSDMESLAAFLTDPDSEGKVKAARDSFEFRVKAIEKLCKD